MSRKSTPPPGLTAKGRRMYERVKESGSAHAPAAKKRTRNPTHGWRIFQGCDTDQIDGVTGKPAVPHAWYFEPEDYDGDTLYSRGMATEEEAIVAARHSSAESNPPPSKTRSTKPLSVNEFSDRVRAIVAKAPKWSRFGNKVFLGHIQDELGLEKLEFDALVLEANRQGLIELSRADLVAALDPELVRRSQVQYRLGGRVVAEFHFVTDPDLTPWGTRRR